MQALYVLIFWVLAVSKSLLFWVYLWQLKDYHLGRFFAHFDTFKGKAIFHNKVFFLKIALLIYPFFFLALGRFVSGALSLYFLRWYDLVVYYFYFFLAFVALWQFVEKKALLPKFNIKTYLLTCVSIIMVLYGAYYGDLFLARPLMHWTIIFDFGLVNLLLIDLLVPLLVSGVILLLQPLTFIWRNFKLWQATGKRAKFPNLKVLAITGSYGKSSTKELLGAILESKFKVLKTEKNQNSEIGIAQTILNKLNSEHQVYICEMGAYVKGGIKMLCNIARPQFGILTGVNAQHLATFGSQKNTLDAKFELLQYLPETGAAIANCDSQFVKENLPRYKSSIKAKNILKVGSQNDNDCQIKNLQIQKDKVSFQVSLAGQNADLALNFFGGRAIAEDAALALAGAQSLGVSLPEGAKILQNLTQINSPVKVLKSKQGFDSIISAYSSNPTGVSDALDYLKLWQGRKVMVMPCIIELGSEGKRIHYELGQKIGRVCDLAIITSRDYFKQIRLGAQQSGMLKCRVIFMENQSGIIKTINEFIGQVPDSAVLLEGRVPEKLALHFASRN